MSEPSHLGIPSELLEALLNNPHESLILVDCQGIVRYISRSNEGFYGASRKEAIGRHILELNPDSELLRVLRYRPRRDWPAFSSPGQGADRVPHTPPR